MSEGKRTWTLGATRFHPEKNFYGTLAEAEKRALWRYEHERITFERWRKAHNNKAIE